MNDITGQALYLLALINPISKIMFLSSFMEVSGKECRKIAMRSTLVALIILVTFTICGKLILNDIFHVQIYAMKITGGIILFTMGMKAVLKGLYYEKGDGETLMALSIVPLASPMIAGPATIAATVSLSSHLGLGIVLIALALALGANLLFMLSTPHIAGLLQRYNIAGALIRITGLIVAAMAVQMTLSGIEDWLISLHTSKGS